MNVFKFRVVLDTEEDIFRDIEISAEQTLADLYEAIVAAFGFGGGVMSSFFMSNENWDKGQEITLLDMGEDESNPWVMNKCVLNEIITEEFQKMILVYDFMRMWCFYVELVQETNLPAGTALPRVSLQVGEAPSEESKELADGDFTDMNLNDLDDDEDLEDEIGDMFDDFSDFNEETDDF